MTLTIIVPCFNEADNVSNVEHTLLPVVRSLAELGSVELLFVDDGSSDDTHAVFDALARRHGNEGLTLRVLSHARNMGLGAALRTGFTHASGDIIVTTDSDATYRFEEIPALLDRLTPTVDIVTASPYHPDGAVAGVEPHRLLLSRGSSWIYRRLVRADVHTYTALFRAYRREVLEATPFSANGFLAGTELLVNALKAGYQVTEYPTVLHSRVVGTSKARLVRTIRAHLQYQGRVLLAHLGLVRAPWAAVAPGAGAAPRRQLSAGVNAPWSGL